MPIIGKHYDLDTDGTLANNSNNTIASQKAIKTYVDNIIPSQSGQSGKFLTTDGTNPSWATVTAGGGTVTSVQVQATSPVQSSTSTAQSTSLNTTISLADAYGDTKNPYGTKTAKYVLAGPTSGSAAAPTFRALEKSDIPLTSETAVSEGTTTSLVTTGEKYTWNSKQDALSTQTAYTSKGSATKVPQITTNTLGQVTGITEVTITQPTVNNKTITIQKNSTTVDSFTLNQSTDKTINITVPTTASDVGAVASNTAITGATKCKITYDSKGLVTAGADLSAGDIPDLSATYLTSHQSIKTLKTDNTSAQTTSSSEAIAGSGTINLHKVSKTGSYNDLNNKPTIPATNVIPATTTANKVLVSTTTSGTAKWSDFSTAGLLKTNTSGVISVDTTSYGTYSKPSGGIPASDLAESYYLASNPNGYTSNAGTVTSVQVQAGTGLTSSTSTAQTTTLNTTIGVDSNYKLPTTTEWNGKQNTISDLGYIRNKAALVDDKISGVDITNSGSSLPATTSYSVGNTFLNTSDNKLYTTEAPAWKLNTGTSYDGTISVDLTTGLATGFGTGSYSSYSMYTPMSNFNWNGSNRQHIYFHFSMSSNTNTGYMWGVYNSSNYRLHIRYNGTYFYFTYFRYYSGTWYGYFDTQLFSTTPQINTEYYIHLYKNGDECVGTLALDDYDTNIVETSTIPTTDVSITSGNYCIGGNQTRYATLSGMSVYLADTTGEFIVADGALTWDSGVTLEDNTQYNDTTNEKTYYYNNSILYQSAPSIDNSTITKNSNSQLQTVGVKDTRSSNTIKTWTGTRAQYDAIETKNPNTLYNITDDTDTTAAMLELLYPVGAVYIGTMDVCPLATLGIGSWEKIAEDQVLQGSSTNHSAGSVISAGLPNITGSLYSVYTSNRPGEGGESTTGAFGIDSSTNVSRDGGGSASDAEYGFNFDASRSSSIYGNSNTVQPPAFVVNIWRRIS